MYSYSIYSDCTSTLRIRLSTFSIYNVRIYLFVVKKGLKQKLILGVMHAHGCMFVIKREGFVKCMFGNEMS